jgi:DNA-binding transcriptional MerR regulator/methylmalonyl-CoA mutase cobalamin-binding subunit
MYTIRQASRITGVSEASLRAWERRYGVVVPRRTEAGYRVYDSDTLAVVSDMRRLVDAGWAPREAARALRSGTAPPPEPTPADAGPAASGLPAAITLMRSFLTSAAAMDISGTEESLDGGFALGSFEHVVDSWLFPTLEALGEGWAQGELDVGAEHAASHAVHRRLSAAFEAAGSRTRGPAVVVGLPPGSLHELGALAFATALRRVGHDVLYLGADVPTASWQAAVEGHRARAAVLAVVTPDDRSAAAVVARALRQDDPDLLVATGGAAGEHIESARTLASSIAAAARELDHLLLDEAA